MPDKPPEPLYTFRVTMEPVLCLLPIKRESKELLYVGTTSGHVHVWDLEIKREKIKNKVGSEACLCILFNNDIFITQQKGDCIKFWSENSDFNWKLVKILKHDYCGFCKMDLFENVIYIPNSGGDMVIHDFVNNKEKIIVGGKNLGDIMCLKVIFSIECVLTCYESGEMILWDDKCSIIFQTKITRDCPMALDFCEQSNEGILGTNSNTILKFLLNKENKTITVVRETVLTNPGVSSVTINKEGKLCVLGCWDSRIRYLTMKKLTLLAVLTHHYESIDCVAFFNEDLSFCSKGLIVAGGKDSRVSLWNLYTKSLK